MNKIPTKTPTTTPLGGINFVWLSQLNPFLPHHNEIRIRRGSKSADFVTFL